MVWEKTKKFKKKLKKSEKKIKKLGKKYKNYLIIITRIL